MKAEIEARLTTLATNHEWTRLEDQILDKAMVKLRPQAAALFLQLGLEHQAACRWMEAMQCYRIAVTAYAAHVLTTEDLEVRRRRYRRKERYERKFSLACFELSKQNPPQRLANGEALAVQEIWKDGYQRLRDLVLRDQYAQADALLLGLESLRDYDDQTPEIAMSCEFEELGNALVKKHPHAARWFYQNAIEWHQRWVSSAGCGCDGIARSSERCGAERKLAKLEQRLAGNGSKE